MTWRALLLGLGLALFISGYTFFNDQIINQTFLTGNHLPPGVFGLMLVGLLVLNPLLRLGGRALPIKPGEWAVIVAMGLSVCAWPGSTFYRTFGHLMVLPAYWHQSRPTWPATGVLSYLPGGSPRLAEGYVLSFGQLAEALRSADAIEQPVLAAAWRQLSPQGQHAAHRLARDGRSNGDDWQLLLSELNHVIDDPTFHAAWPREALPVSAREALARAEALTARAELLRQQQHRPRPREADDEPDADHTSTRASAALGRAAALDAQALRQHQFANRHLLVAAAPQLLREPPRGEGLLLAGGQDLPFVTHVPLMGWDGETPLGVADLPWAIWWPTLRLWGGAALMLALASLCLALIVHPQWAQRELLPYPTVRFVEAVTASSPSGWLPSVLSHRVFWLGLVFVASWHLLEGLSQWQPGMPAVSRELNFLPLAELFPNVARVNGSGYLFRPTLYFSVIGFAFFIQTRIALSLGMSIVLWCVVGGVLFAHGVALRHDRLMLDHNGPAMRFGAFVGMTLMIIYFGRWYYLNVVLTATGLRRDATVPGYARWAARGMGLCIAGAVFMLVRYGGMSPMIATMFVALTLMLLLVMARINVETGLFYAQPDWLPGVMLAGVFGVAGLGPEALLILMLASTVLTADPREAIMTYLSNALRMSESIANVPPRRIAPIFAGLIIVGLFVAGFVTLQLQYNYGLSQNRYAHNLPIRPIERVATTISELSARGELVQATGLAGLDHFRHIQPNTSIVLWAMLGLGLVIACATARLRLPWWPLHPVIFLVWGTYPANRFAFSFLIAAALKTLLTSIGGERLHRHAQPIMVGFIAGELLMIVAWSVVGTTYYFITGLHPEVHRALP